MLSASRIEASVCGGEPRRTPEKTEVMLDSRHEQAPTALTSNIKLGEWGKYLGDATLAAAIHDRLAATSIRIDIDGPSYRDYLAKQRAKAHGIADDAA